MKESTSAYLNSKLHALSHSGKFPVRAMFEVTYRCNFRCQHCYLPEAHLSGKAGKELDFDKICTILAELRNLGVFYLGFTGGEVFVRKDMVAILDFAKKQGFQVMVNTNGFFIDEKLADALAHLQLNKVDISVHSLNTEAYAAFTGIEKSKDKILRAIRLLHERKVPLGLKTNLMQFNRDEIKEIRELAASVGAFHRMDGEMHPRWDGDFSPYDFAMEPLEVDEVIRSSNPHGQSSIPMTGAREMERQRASTVDTKRSVQTGRHALFTCGVGTTGVAITPSGDLKPCLQLLNPRFSIEEFGLSGAWHKIQSYFEAFKPDEAYECNVCEYASKCKWCPAISHLETGSMTKCTRRAKYRAVERTEVMQGVTHSGG